jgi:alpha-D-xyloside xylohydrolase
VASGGPNEVWSYGEEVFGVCKGYLALREKLRDYVREILLQAHQHGDPVIRPLFYEFPGDGNSWMVDEQYMFGDRYLVAPVRKLKQWKKQVYLPRGSRWRLLSVTGEVEGPEYTGGQLVEVHCPLAYMPVFQRFPA